MTKAIILNTGVLIAFKGYKNYKLIRIFKKTLMKNVCLNSIQMNYN